MSLSSIRVKERKGRKVKHGGNDALGFRYIYMNARPFFYATLKALYQRLVANGKAKKLALTVLMRKIIVLANLLLKNPHFTLAT